MYQSQIEKRQAGTKAQQRTNVEVTTSSQNFAKPDVNGWAGVELLAFN